jgi:uncharacterized protein YkwD
MRKTDFLKVSALIVALAMATCAAYGEDCKCGPTCPCSPKAVVKPAPLADQTGFTQSLNEVRTKLGLPTVVYDPTLNPIAKANNAEQAVKGQGHHFLGGYGQCAYVGPRNSLEALFGFFQLDKYATGYLGSPSHAGLLLHPKAKRIGVDHTGNVNTIVIAF